MTDLPEVKDWCEMSLGELWVQLNDPRRRSTPKSSVEAIMHCVRERSLPALKEPANLERLSRCDAAAKAEINKRIEALLQQDRRDEPAA
ncbi:MAG: hypothetical protein ACLQF4_00505 [Xanthobacteraceae bacterium]